MKSAINRGKSTPYIAQHQQKYDTDFILDGFQGIVGTDSRRYIIDLCRSTAQDANFKGPKNIMAVLRPELITILNETNTGLSTSTKTNEGIFGSNFSSFCILCIILIFVI